MPDVKKERANPRGKWVAADFVEDEPQFQRPDADSYRLVDRADLIRVAASNLQSAVGWARLREGKEFWSHVYRRLNEIADGIDNYKQDVGGGA